MDKTLNKSMDPYPCVNNVTIKYILKYGNSNAFGTKLKYNE